MAVLNWKHQSLGTSANCMLTSGNIPHDRRVVNRARYKVVAVWGPGEVQHIPFVSAASTKQKHHRHAQERDQLCFGRFHLKACRR